MKLYKQKNPDSSPASNIRERNYRDCDTKLLIIWNISDFFNKLFSEKRLSKYFLIHKDEGKAISHYRCNIELSEAFYSCISVLEVALRNAICRELTKMAGREDWYVYFLSTPGLKDFNKYITIANQHIAARKEIVSHSKIIAELTLGFWVAMFNTEYEKLLWKDLRRAFPFMPKQIRKRKTIAKSLNRIRNLRNRIFHHEPICWNIEVVLELHKEMLTVMGWINKDLPEWYSEMDRLGEVTTLIKGRLDW